MIPVTLETLRLLDRSWAPELFGLGLGIKLTITFFVFLSFFP